MHPIIAALNLTELPAPEVELLQKILNDNLISIRCQQLMIEQFAPEAIRQLHPSYERPAFLKRIGAVPKPKARAVWGVVYVDISNRAFVKAECPLCKQCMQYGPPEKQNRTVYDRSSGEPVSHRIVGITTDALNQSVASLAWTHCGILDKAPAHVVAEWSEYLKTLVAK
jgi:hypothetical protein